MTRLNKKDVEHVAHLARLSFSEAELETFTKQLDEIIEFAEQLNELDTENVEPTTHVLEMNNVLREDESRDWLTREEALKNAPAKQDGQVKVPSVLE
jgi:aspartyl-tRNA(Asn)/glutamyl-tRNA(Gln) amidotransferase subunit C